MYTVLLCIASLPIAIWWIRGFAQITREAFVSHDPPAYVPRHNRNYRSATTAIPWTGVILKELYT